METDFKDKLQLDKNNIQYLVFIEKLVFKKEDKVNDFKKEN